MEAIIIAVAGFFVLKFADALLDHVIFDPIIDRIVNLVKKLSGKWKHSNEPQTKVYRPAQRRTSTPPKPQPVTPQRRTAPKSVVSVKKVTLSSLESKAQIIDNGRCGGLFPWKTVGWTLDADGTLMIFGRGKMRNYTLFHAPWYAQREQIQRVVIDAGVKTIGSSAFQHCTALSSVTIPDSVTAIGENAFSYCKSLSSIGIPAGVTKIGSYSFFGCTSLIDISVALSNSHYSSPDGVLFDKQQEVLIAYPAGKNVSEYVIPVGVTTVGDYAFDNCTSLNSVMIPDGVVCIGTGAFCNCNGLNRITIPGSINRIGSYTFQNCTNLNSVMIPDSVTAIGNSAFRNCTSLSSVTIGNGVTGIGEGAFAGCTGLHDVIIPKSVTTIGSYAFFGCTNLAWWITIPANVELGQNVFPSTTTPKRR